MTDLPPPPPPPPVQTHRRLLLAAAAVLVVTLTAGIAIFAVNQLRGNDGGVPRPAGMLAGTFPTPPTPAWMIDAESLVDGPDPHLMTPVHYLHYGSAGFVEVDDRIIIRAATKFPMATESGRLIALDSTDGAVEWETSSSYSGCAREAVDGVLPCIHHDDPAEPGTVQFIKTSDGTVASTHTPDFSVSAIATQGGKIILAGSDSDTIVITNGTVEDPTSGWLHRYSTDHCGGGSDLIDLTADANLVVARIGGVAAIARTSDGSAVAENISWAADLAGQGFATGGCVDGNLMNLSSTRVVDASGETSFETSEQPLHSALSVTKRSDVPVIVAGVKALDSSSGNQLWERPEYDGKVSSGIAVVGDTLLANTGSTLNALDVDTGTTLWANSTSTESSPVEVTDGRSVMVINSGAISALSLTDGAELWSTSVEGEDGSLGAAQAGLVYMSSKKIGLFRPTGDPSEIPGGATEKDPPLEVSDDPRYVTKCGTAPRFTPVATKTDTDSLLLTMRITATCPDGDVLSASETRLSITTAGANVASALFDLSKTPIAVPPHDDAVSNGAFVEQEFRFPLGTFWRTPDSYSQASASGSRSSSQVPSTIVVECEQNGSSSTNSGSVGSRDAERPAIVATGPARPATGDAESASFDALRALADSDRPHVTSDLTERWVPQLSSKRPGLVADGITWNNAEALREHLRLRLAHPNVRLLWSGEWSTFSATNFWVTVSGVTFPAATGAVSWCDTNGFAPEHCYAKLVSTTHPIEGSTVLRN